MTNHGEGLDRDQTLDFGLIPGVRRTGTGVALRALDADDGCGDVLSPEHRALVTQAADDAEAPNTVRTYRSPVSRFEAWCASHGYTALPAAPAVVAAFLADAGDDHTGEGDYRYPTSTLSMWSSAISTHHRTAEHPDPTRAATVRTTLTAIRKNRTAAGHEARPADALLAADIRTVVEAITANTTPGDWAQQLTAIRDTALIVCGFFAGRRREELSALEFRDLSIVAEQPLSALDPPSLAEEGQLKMEWIRMRMRGTKISRTEMQYAWLPRSQDPWLCPWCTLLAWMNLVALHDTTVEAAKRANKPAHQQLRAARRALIAHVDEVARRDPDAGHRCDTTLPVGPRVTAPIWRALTKSTRYLPVDTGRPLSPQSVPIILKKRCEQAGFAPERIARISGHSLRAGFVTELRARGVPAADIMRQTGHKRVETLMRYDRTDGHVNNGVNQIPL